MEICVAIDFTIPKKIPGIKPASDSYVKLIKNDDIVVLYYMYT